jgi:hypothetical protein
MDPQPPVDSALQFGHDPSEKGAVYIKTCTLNGQKNAEAVWLADGENAPAVDPEALAQAAVAKMKLVGPDIASPRAAGRYTVGVPVWMWVNRSATTYGPNTVSASAGGVTVTATAEVSKIVWQMGDGATVTCTGPGTVYKASADMVKSPTCGHVYSQTSADQQGGKFTLSVTSTWRINWQVSGGGGATGQFTETRQSQIRAGIGELQVVR